MTSNYERAHITTLRRSACNAGRGNELPSIQISILNEGESIHVPESSAQGGRALTPLPIAKAAVLHTSGLFLGYVTTSNDGRGRSCRVCYNY
jgi:hypothetical protein